MLYKDGRIAVVQQTLNAGLYQNPWEHTDLTLGTSNVINWSGGITCIGSASFSLAALTTLQTAIDITGSGYCDLLALQCTLATAGTLRIVITVDGVVLSDYTTVSGSGARILMAWAEYHGVAGYIVPKAVPIYYRTSLNVKVQQSISLGGILHYRNFAAAPYSA